MSSNNMRTIMELIVAMDRNCGIGYDGNIPWHSPEDFKFFRKKTLDRTLIVGRKTAQILPSLDRRRILCLTRGTPKTERWNNEVTIIKSLSEAEGDLIVAGGAETYREALLKPDYISKVYLTIIKGEYRCDTYFDMDWLKGFKTSFLHISRETGNHYLTLERGNSSESQYLELLDKVLREGNQRQGRNGPTRSLFLNHFKFDLRQGFPLLTTKKMFLRGILEEFLFFLRGDTDSSSLSQSNVKIWEGNTSKEFLASLALPYAEGVMGPMYGYQWRYFNAPYEVNEEGRPLQPEGGIDQLSQVVKLIRECPNSRRIIMTAYNPAQAESGVLYPCHSIVIQFYVEGDFLDMSCYNRSQDLFLGVPYNIASSSLLLLVVASITNKIPRFMHMIMGDTHLYESHLTQARVQTKRIPFSFPTLELPAIQDLSDIPSLKASDFKLLNYSYFPTIKAPMIA